MLNLYEYVFPSFLYKGMDSVLIYISPDYRQLLRVRYVKEEWLNYFQRSSFDVLQGCANSGPGRLGILEVTWTDGLGFSLCAALLDIIGSCISE